MGTLMILKVILTDGSAQRLTLPNGLPASLDDFLIEVKNQCGLTDHFKLQFKDSLLGGDFMNLTSLSEVEDRGTLQVVDKSLILYPVLPSRMPSPSGDPESSFQSDGSVDTDILSSGSSAGSSESSSSRSFWPAVFPVPKFKSDAELELEKGNLAYTQNGTVLIPSPKLRSAILAGLLEEIVRYKVYVSEKELEQVAQALVKKHPCVTEKGSAKGHDGWTASLKHKVANHRSALRKLGCPEVTVNSLKNKPAGKRSAAYAVKKAKKAEVLFTFTCMTALYCVLSVLVI